jgi:hypothetical protein
MHGKWITPEMEKMAKDHAEWFANIFSQIIKIVYYNTFLHGLGHGLRIAKKQQCECDKHGKD